MINMPYRPYIDGLRAIAVIAVIFFHFGWPVLAGGFVGVDVFFVISGFLITQLLSEPSSLPVSKQLAQFYLRRVRRIVPALVATSVITAIAGMVIFLPADLARLGRYLLFVPLMLNNLANWQDGGYFATAGDFFFPLSHYWSLAVEEQFYIAYPIAFLLLVRARRGLPVTALALIAGVSIAICLIGGSRHPLAFFYLTPARAWELMLGAIAARYPVTWFSSRTLTECVVSACLAMILLAFHALDAATGFPHPYVALPCCATALLLFICRRRATWVTKVLSLPPLAFTGKISYSLYLWHVPILAFAQYFAIRSLSVGAQCMLLLLIYAVAVVSWLYVETPVRSRSLFKSDRALIVAASTGCLLSGALGAWFWLGHGLPWRMSHDIRILEQVAPLPHEATACGTLPLPAIASGNLCRFGAMGNGVPRVALWGDSHALALLPAFESLAESKGIELYFADHPSCLPLLGARSGSSGTGGPDACNSFNAAMLSAVQQIRPDVTILSAFWSPDGTSPPAIESRLESTVAAIRATGSSACIVLDVPELPYIMPYALAMARRRSLDATFLYPVRADISARYSGFENAVRALEVRKELRYIDPKDVLCSGARCEIEYAGHTLYRDMNHLAEAGAMRVANSLASCLPERR